MRIPNPQDFYAGVLFVGLGLACVLLGRDYAFGSVAAPGPGFFPRLLGIALALLGLRVAVAGLRDGTGQPVPPLPRAALLRVSGAVLGFAFALEVAGLVAAVPVLVVIALAGRPGIGWRHWLAASVVAVLFAYLVFVRALGLAIPLLPPGLAWLPVQSATPWS